MKLAKEMRVVYVEWMDATSYHNFGEKHGAFPSDFEDYSAQLCINVGLLVGEDDKVVVLTECFTPDNKTYDHPMVIPKAYISEMRVLKPSQLPRKRKYEGWNKT